MYDAFVVALAVFIGVAGHEMFGMSMLSRPIVVAPLAGALMGDLQTGLIVGASLEAIFMGVVNIGISSTAEPSLAAGLATAFAIKMGGCGYSHCLSTSSIRITVNEYDFFFCMWTDGC